MHIKKRLQGYTLISYYSWISLGGEIMGEHISFEFSDLYYLMICIIHVITKEIIKGIFLKKH